METRSRVLQERCCCPELTEMDVDFNTPKEVLGPALLLLCAGVLLLLVVAGLILVGVRIFT